MNWAALAAIVNVLGALGVIGTLFFLALQIRANTRVVSAQSRHAISEFGLWISIFRAENADRLAKLQSGTDVTDEDRLFQYWCHVQVILHAETYFHYYDLGLMTDTHWRRYVRYINGYMQSPGFTEVWTEIGPSFSEDFARWVDEQLAQLSRQKTSAKQQGAAEPIAPADVASRRG